MIAKSIKNSLLLCTAINKSQKHTIKLSLRYYTSQCKLSTNEALQSQIRVDAAHKCASFTFKDMIEYSSSYNRTSSNKNAHFNKIQSAEFVRRQLIILVASMINDFNNLPYNVNEHPMIEEVIQIYVESYQLIKSINNIQSIEGTNLFNETIKKYMDLGANIVAKVCIGLQEMAQSKNYYSPLNECPYFNRFIDIIIERRLAIRTLLGHYRALHSDNERYGIFEQNCDVMSCVEQAVEDAKALALYTYGNEVKLPSLDVLDKRKYEDFDYVFVPEMIQGFTLELVKNSLRAIIENPKESEEGYLRVIVVNSKVDGSVSIKCEDNGGGIKRSQIDKIWFYSYTTSSSVNGIHRKTQLELLDMELKQIEKPMYGVGYGLAVLASEIKYFGGDCKINSMDGYGTDAYLRLPNLKMSQKNAFLT